MEVSVIGGWGSRHVPHLKGGLKRLVTGKGGPPHTCRSSHTRNPRWSEGTRQGVGVEGQQHSQFCLFNYGFIEIWFMYDTPHKFKVCNSTVAKSWATITTLNFRTSHLLQRKPHTYFPPTSHAQPYATTKLLSICVDLPFWTLQIRANAQCVVFHVVFHDSLRAAVFQASSVQTALHFWLPAHPCKDGPHFVYPLISWWTFGLFPNLCTSFHACIHFHSFGAYTWKWNYCITHRPRKEANILVRLHQALFRVC